MKITARFIVMAWCFCGVMSVLSITARAQQLPENFRDLKLYELDRAAKAAGLNVEDTAETFIAWMGTNDWQSMELHDLYNLYSWISESSVARRHFSARWTGSLTATATEAYTLRQVQVYAGGNCSLKVVIGGDTVLDSGGESSDESRFTSRPVQLTASQALPIRVEMVHNVSRISDFGESVPMVLLTWKTSPGSETIVPTSVFTPPAGFGGASAHGLKGQYFADTEFGDLKSTRLDAALDMVWSWPPAISIHEEAARDVLSALKVKILDAAFLSQCAAEGKSEVFSYSMWRIAYRMRATERLRLVETLTGRPDVLAAMTPEAMGRLMQAIYMLPGDEHINLLGEWTLARPQPRCVAGEFPGWGDDYYQKLNTDYYWQMGRFMQGPYGNDAGTLCDDYLEGPDGKCNLAVAYTAGYASRLNGTIEEFINRLDQHINDESVTGDKLMTWLIARAFAKGAFPGNPQPLANFSDLESAMLVAESNDYKFWALQEMVARLSSVNKGDRAKALIEENCGQFTTPAQQAAMNEWAAKADALAEIYAQRQTAQEEATRTAYEAELERRRQLAIEQGDSAAASRFAELISASQSQVEE
jgi:hypothetical protein